MAHDFLATRVFAPQSVLAFLTLLACVDCEADDVEDGEPDTSSGSPASSGSSSDGGSTSSGSSSDGGSTSSDGSNDGGSTSSSDSSDGGSTSSSDSSDASTTGSDPRACEHPGFLCAEPLPCTEAGSCGGRSWLDERGCPQLSCSSHEDCDGDALCYHALAWGECASSGFSCMDVDDACVCQSTADCGGAYCVPPDGYPVVHDATVELTPLPGRVFSRCGGGGGVITTIDLATAPLECEFSPDDLLTLEAYWYSGSAGGELDLFGQAVVRYDRNGDGEFAEDETSQTAWMRVHTADWSSGEIEFVFDGVLYFVRFAELPVCERPTGCI